MHNKNNTTLLLFLAMMAAPVVAAVSGPISVSGGEVSGVPGRDPSLTSFKGIPFAAPPVGDLRWRPPQPVLPWHGVKAADQFGTSCIQRVVTGSKPWTYEFMTHNRIGEDCLYLNVWTGANSVSAKMPVFVYIYGGAFNEGSGAVPAYDGEGLAKKGLVVVTFNYRVGVLGFLAHPDLTRESEHKSSGNYGLLDQVAALRWVHENISKFGGDPAAVTIAGQSAGASSVHALTAPPLAKGLFARAIAQSGSSISGLTSKGTSLEEAEAVGVTFAAARGAKSIADLRAMSWQKAIEPVQGGGRGVRLIVDGWFLPLHIGSTFAQGKQNDVPTLTGCNKGEGGATPNPTVTAAVLQNEAKQRYGDFADEFLKLYPAETDEQARKSQNEASWDQERVSEFLWAEKRGATARAPAYTYFWDHTLPGADAQLYGAFHTSEVPYVFNSLGMSDRPFTDADREIADQVSSYWANFAKTGNPNGNGLPVWPAVSGKPETMEIGDKPGPIPIASSLARIAFWEKYLSR